MKIKGLLLIIGCLALLSSTCNNSTSVVNHEEARANMEQLLMNEYGWRIVKSEVTPGIMGRTDIFSDLDSCDKDDVEYYKEGGLAVYDEGPLKCSPEADQMVTDRWMLGADSALIIYSDDIANSDTFYILSINEFELVSTYKHEIGGRVYTFVDTYMINKKRNP